jgi:outer membrane assembly lipoprotein YfiO
MVVLGGVCLPGPATAQEQYTLDEQGWQKQATPDPDSPAGQLQTIRKRIVEDRPGRAKVLAERWLKQYPNHPNRPEARLLLGDAMVAQHDYYQSLTHYELLLRQYPGSDHFQTALRREYYIARQFVNGLNRKWLGMRVFPAEGEGEELLIRIQERAPGSRIGEKASLALADYYFRNGQMELAATAYDLFLINYPNSLKRQWAMQRLIEASLARFGGPPYDPTGLLEARQRLETFTNEFPAAAERLGARSLRVRINESLARNELRTAEWYTGQGKTRSGVILYRRVIEAYPETAAARIALKRVKRLQTPLMDTDALKTGRGTAPPPQPENARDGEPTQSSQRDAGPIVPDNPSALPEETTP